MKLKYNFQIIRMKGTVSAVPVGKNAGEFQGMLTLNETGAKMLECIAESDSPEQAHEKLCAAYPEEDRNEVGNNLCEFLNQLIREGILIP